MVFHHFAHETHFFVERQLELCKYFGNHTAADDFVAVEGPAVIFFEFLCGRLADIVEDGGPAQPEIGSVPADVVEHLEGMVKVVFVAVAIDVFGAGEVDHLREDDLQQAGAIEEIEADGGFFAEDDLVQLVGDAFLGNDLYPGGVFRDGVEGSFGDGEVELGGETDGAE